MKKLEEYPNFLEQGTHYNIKNIIEGGSFPLFYQADTMTYDLMEYSTATNLNKKYNIINEGHSFFGHMLIKDYKIVSPFVDLFTPVIKKVQDLIPEYHLVRAKLSVCPKKEDHISSGWHYDLTPDEKSEYITTIYYINSNNGYTLLSEGTKVTSLANKLVLFPGDTLHTGITQTDTDIRIFLNLNFLKK